MFKKISVAVLIGLLGTLFFAQYDPWTHKTMIEMCQSISRNYLGGNFSCTIQSLNFFSPSIIMSDVEMSSIETGSWVWRCKRCEINGSWLQLLFKGVVDQHVVIDGFECASLSHDMHCAIEPHCMAMMQKTFLPFSTELKTIIFKNAHLFIEDSAMHTVASFFFNSSSLRIGRQLKTAMSIGDGYIEYEKNKYIEKIATDISLTTGYVNNLLEVNFNVMGSFLLSHMGDHGGCYLSGQWKSDHGRFSVRNAHNSIMIDPIIITENEVRVNARFPVSYVAQCMRNSVSNQIINGTIHCSAKISRDESRRIDGHMVVEDVMINQHHICDTAKMVFARHGYDWRVKLGLSRRNEECKGSGYWHEAIRKGELIMHNATELSAKALPYWRINRNDL